MTRALLIAFLFMLLMSCGGVPAEPGLKAFVGGSLQAGPEAALIPYSIVIVSDGKIRAVGPQATTPVPKGSETISTKGKTVIMALGAKAEVGQAADFSIRDLSTGSVEIYKDGERVAR